MSEVVKIAFGSPSALKGNALVVFVGADMKPAPAVTARFGDLEPLIRAAAKASNFHGAQRTALDILAPAGIEASRLMVVGVAPGKDDGAIDFVTLGGFVFGKLTGAHKVEIAFEPPRGLGTAPRPPTLPWDCACAAIAFRSIRRVRRIRTRRALRRLIFTSA